MQSDSLSTYDEKPRSPSPYLLWFTWLMWLPFLIQPAVAFIQMPPSFQKTAALGGLALFFVVYLLATWQEAHRLTHVTLLDATPRLGMWQWAPILALAVLSVLLPFVQGAWGLGGFIYTSASIAGRLPTRQAAFAFSVLMFLTSVVGAINGFPWDTIALMVFIVGAAGATTAIFSRAIQTNQQLRLARREIARLAVSEERLRFARDLHDLLGHTLSLITLKSELAGQLIPEEPEQAQHEVHDIEAAARTALQEVREAVAGYRQSTLASELLHAQELLAAAGIQCSVQDEVGTLPAAIEAQLTWVVREGVTNVIRHSRAMQCVIALVHQPGELRMTISDDGRGSKDSGQIGQLSQLGNGLRGISERVAAQGGRSVAGPTGDRGFQLVVTLPLQPQSGQQSSSVETKETKKGAVA